MGATLYHGAEFWPVWGAEYRCFIDPAIRQENPLSQ